MKPKFLPITAMLALVFVCLLATPLLAITPEPIAGRVERAGNGMITLMSPDGMVHNYPVDQFARITLNGRVAKLSDLRLGTLAAIIVERRPRGRVATQIVAHSPP